jgi:hypothetical protein
MRSVEQVQLKEIPERPHRLGSYPNRGMGKRYVPDWGDDRAGQPTAHAVRQPGRAGSWIAELGIVSHETIKKVDEQFSDSEISRLESRKLVAQYSILVVIVGIVSWLIAA